MQMSNERSDKLFRVVLFVLVIFGIVEIQPLLEILLSGDLLHLAITFTFFGVLFLMYGFVVKFLEMEGKSGLSSVGVEVDDRFPIDLFIGGIAGGIAAGFVWAVAYRFGADLRAEISLELVVGEAVITTLVAFFEELAYRGYMMTRMAEVSGRRTAVLFSSLVFSVLHFSWWTPLGSIPFHLVVLFTVNLFLGGLVLGISYYASGERLWVPIGFHFLWNMVAYVTFPTFPLEPVSMPEIFQIEWGITTIPGFLVGLAVLYLLLRVLYRKNE
ncbi:CPBP family intramembrane metalloprotease [Candidatus Thorarchaeota archaeon]|nr:MAG: CPBP family intramembrane metalloprotease [Candidatus Thorarchaeota archaeon]